MDSLGSPEEGVVEAANDVEESLDASHRCSDCPTGETRVSFQKPLHLERRDYSGQRDEGRETHGGSLPDGVGNLEESPEEGDVRSPRCLRLLPLSCPRRKVDLEERRELREKRRGLTLISSSARRRESRGKREERRAGGSRAATCCS